MGLNQLHLDRRAHGSKASVISLALVGERPFKHERAITKVWDSTSDKPCRRDKSSFPEVPSALVGLRASASPKGCCAQHLRFGGRKRGVEMEPRPVGPKPSRFRV